MYSRDIRAFPYHRSCPWARFAFGVTAAVEDVAVVERVLPVWEVEEVPTPEAPPSPATHWAGVQLKAGATVRETPYGSKTV